MRFETHVEPLDGKLPRVTYRWDPETDILLVACKGLPKGNGLNGTASGTIELSAASLPEGKNAPTDLAFDVQLSSSAALVHIRCDARQTEELQRMAAHPTSVSLSRATQLNQLYQVTEVRFTSP